MLDLLSTIIGIVFIILLFSLLASSVRELIAGYLSLRGKHLFMAIQSMIGKSNSDVFLQHPFFQQLTIGSREHVTDGKKRIKLPSYINSGTFSAIILDLLQADSPEELQARIDELADGPLKQTLTFLNRQAGGDLVQFKLKVEEWFNEVMDRASGLFKRNTQRWLFIIGLGIAGIFNVDVITIYHNLSINPTLRDALANQATAYVQSQPAPQAANLDSIDIDATQAKISTLINDNISALESPLGLGWDTVKAEETKDPKWWLYKLFGWLVAAMSISLGASFWFDLLKKLVSLRSSGPAPSSTAASGLGATQGPPPAGSTLTRPEPESVLERGMPKRGEPAAKPKDPNRLGFNKKTGTP